MTCEVYINIKKNKYITIKYDIINAPEMYDLSQFTEQTADVTYKTTLMIALSVFSLYLLCCDFIYLKY
jgi:hypothetical protein